MPDTSKMTAEQYAAHTGKMSYPAGQAKSDVVEAVKDAFLPLKPLVEKYESHWDRATREAIGTPEAKMWEVPSQGESMSEPNCEPNMDILTRERRDAKSMSEPRKHCRACGKLLCDDNVADGCPCNGPVGCNHGLVSSRTCLCDICDPERTGSVRAYQSGMSEFEFGQTVWARATGRSQKFIFRASNDGMAWCEVHPDEPAQNERYKNVLLEYLTATDPNAKPLPQNCPFCGEKAIVYTVESGQVMVYCSAGDGKGARPCLRGPFKSNSDEAVAAWNSLRVIQPGEFTGDLCEALRKAADDCKFKIDDHDAIEAFAEKHGIPWPDNHPLPEEWLKKVGLWDGVGDDKEVEVFLGATGDVVFRIDQRHETAMKSNIKTIGDARQLCRLLGVPLNESQPPVNPLAHAQEVYQGILEDYKKSREPLKE